MGRNSAKQIALCGVLAALAVVIMCLGSLLLLATFITPIVCCIQLHIILWLCGKRLAWAWYAAVSVLCLLLAPDKEAAALFVFLGYYPIVKPWLDRRWLPWLWKTLLFNGAVLTMYSLLIHLFGMEALAAEFADMGTVLLVITLALGNVIFWMLDRILSRRFRRR